MSENLRAEIGSRLREEAGRKKLHAAALGAVMGCSRRAVVYYFNGRYTLDAVQLFRLFEAGFDIFYIVLGKRGVKIDWPEFLKSQEQ
jgi:transcriptional regulator with XRE-family HTH domain